MKHCMKWILMAWLLTAWAVPAHAALVDGIAAVVNKEVITFRELDEALDLYADSLPKTLSSEQKDAIMKQSRPAMLNRMIDNLLVAQEAKRLGITIKDDEVTANVQDMIGQRKMTLDQFKEALKKEGTTYEAYRRDMKEHLTRMRLAAREVRSKVTVSDDEIGEYYGKHRDVYEGKEAVNIKQILFAVPPKADADARQKIQEVAQAAEAKLKSGASFEQVMAEYAKVADTHGGSDLGFIEKGTMLPEVDQVAFALKPGEASPVIVSPMGFHIIQVVDKRGAGLKPLNMVREEIQEAIGKEKMEKRAQEWIQDLRKRSFIDIKVQMNM